MPYTPPFVTVLDPNWDSHLPYQPTRYHNELYKAHEPLNYGEASNGYPWFKFTGAVSNMFDQIDTYARDQDDGTPGWGICLDVNRCPSEALPWLAQFVGVTINQGLTDAQQRARIRSTDGFKRGSIGAIVGAAQQGLTGTQTVLVRERDPGASPVLGGAYGLTVLTYVAETPNPARTAADVLLQKPAGIILLNQTVVATSYLYMRTTYADYTALRAAFATYTGLRNNAPGT